MGKEQKANKIPHEKMQTKQVVGAVSLYKVAINFIRIFLGVVILSLHSDIQKSIEFLSKYDLMDRNFILIFFSNYIKETSHILTSLLAWTLVIFSVLELIFIFMMAYKNRIGAIGLFITTIIWILTELLFVSKFIVSSKTMIILINLIILFLLYQIIRSHDNYFKD